MKYKADKYTYRIEWSEEDRAHVARCLEFPSLAAHGKTSEDALREIEIAVSETIRWMEEEHEQVPEPLGMKKFKGNITSVSPRTSTAILPSVRLKRGFQLISMCWRGYEALPLPSR